VVSRARRRFIPPWAEVHTRTATGSPSASADENVRDLTRQRSGGGVKDEPAGGCARPPGTA
jgi:hypothetical protein